VTSPTQQRGQWAELKALEYLQNKGLLLVEKNFNCRYGEIDLILKDQQTLVFTEVRYRTGNTHVTALESVDSRKQQHIIRTAQYFLQRHPQHAMCFCRFDVLAIDEVRDLQNFAWIQDAFQS